MSDIRPAQNNSWITIDGSLIPNDEHQKWRKQNKKESKKIVGGNIPIREGTSIMKDTL